MATNQTIIEIEPDFQLSEYLDMMCIPYGFINSGDERGTFMRIYFGQKMSNDELFQFLLDFKRWDDTRFKVK